MINGLKATGWSKHSMPIIQGKAIGYITTFTGHGHLSRFCGFDDNSLSWLFALFGMNCRGFNEENFSSLKVSSHSRRQIRASLFYFCKRLGNNNNNNNDCNYDRLYWLQFGMLSIGIQSLLWIECDTFMIKLNENGHTSDDRYSNYNYEKLEKYLYRFVIEYIESGLRFPIILNQKLSTMARLCLIMAYFVVDEKEKIRSIDYNYVRDESAKNIMGTIWQKIYNVIEKAVNDESDYYSNDDRRIECFISCMERFQQGDIDMKDDNTKNSNCKDQERICDILSNSKNNENFVTWKNAILIRDRYCNFCYNRRQNCKLDLRVCKGCRMTYYCSKKCQRND